MCGVHLYNKLERLGVQAGMKNKILAAHAQRICNAYHTVIWSYYQQIHGLSAVGKTNVPQVGQMLINSLKEEDSELWFVEKKLHTAFTGQSTHEDLVKKSGLRRILFDKS